MPSENSRFARSHRVLFSLVVVISAYALSCWYESAFATPANSSRAPYASKLQPGNSTLYVAAQRNSTTPTEKIILGAREEVARMPVYHSAYYRGGYPPATEGVCTDVIWRAFKFAGYDLKAMIDADIKANRAAYGRVAQPDPNIDFRRVPNLIVFFKRHGTSLSTVLLPDATANLALWKPGDIVTFAGPDHIVILSDKRNAAGFPLTLHNDGPAASESDSFMFWYQNGVTGHFRFPK